MKKPMTKYKMIKVKDNEIFNKIFKESELYAKDGGWITVYSNYTQAKNKAEKLKALGYDCEARQSTTSFKFVIALNK